MLSSTRSVMLAAVPLVTVLILAGNLIALLDRNIEIKTGDNPSDSDTTGTGPGGSSGNTGGTGGTGTGGSSGGGGGGGGGTTNTTTGGTTGNTTTGGGSGTGTGTGNGTGTGTGTGSGTGSGTGGGTGTGSGGGSGTGNPGTNGGGGDPGGSFTPPHIDPFFLLIILVTILAAVAGLIAYRFLRNRKYKAKGKGVATAKPLTAGGGKAAMVQGLMAAEAGLMAATDIREEILRAYRQIHSTLQGRGIGDPPHYTAWDFHRAASRTFRPAGTPFASLTTVFEEARYSHHELTEGHRQEALTAVRDVLASL